MPYVDLPGTRLFYTDEGDGDPPLLLVHGWGADSAGWSALIPQFQTRHRVLAVDLRGHGRSGVPERGYAIGDFVGDLAALLDHAGTGPVVAIGHSMGGQIVSMLAVEHSEHVQAVVCVDPGYGVAGDVVAQFPEIVAALHGPDGVAVAKAVDSGYSYTPATPAWIATLQHRAVDGTPGHVLAEAFEAMFTMPGQFGLRAESEAYLERRTCPSLTFWADPAQASWEAPRLRDARSRVVPWEGAGHYLHEERPDEFVVVVERWLDSLA